MCESDEVVYPIDDVKMHTPFIVFYVEIPGKQLALVAQILGKNTSSNCRGCSSTSELQRKKEEKKVLGRKSC